MEPGIEMIQHIRCEPDGSPSAVTAWFNGEVAEHAAAWHATFPGYEPTPLVSLSALAAELGVAGVFVKDESKRFGLNAFKALGGSHAIGRIIAERLGEPLDALPYERLVSDEVREQLGELTFATATDGNHGRGVAWTANRLRQNSVVYMPHGTAPERLANIRALGSDASIVDMGYDDAVRKAAADAATNGWVLVQDTSWDGYEQIPLWVMQGYTTLAFEAVNQLAEFGVRPTHVFLQAGVGSMAGAVAGFLEDRYGPDRPVITVVEPTQADCLFQTALAADGALHATQGSLATIMVGLACGEVCPLAWDVLDVCADWFVRMPDWVAAEGMRALATPRTGDAAIVSGESGASTFGLAYELLRMDSTVPDARERLGLGADSVVLCISTEGDTDRENYRRIVEEGAFPRID